MMPELDESLILAGLRGWAGSQRALAGVPDPRSPRLVVDAGWYGTDIDEHEGAFCMVRADGPLEGLVGDVLRVSYRGRAWHLYCVGGVSLPVDLALARPAFLRLAPLSEATIPVVVRSVL